MTWLRWDVETPQSDVVGFLVEELRCSPAQALGHYFACCCGFGVHRLDGVAAAVTDATLEQWALWTGKRGRFAIAFRSRCVGDDGRIRGWWRNDANIRKQLKDASRQPSHLRNKQSPVQESNEIPARESGADSGGDGGRRTEDGNEHGTTPPPPGLPGRFVGKLVGHKSRYAIFDFLQALPPRQDLDAWALAVNGCLEGIGTIQGQPARVDEVAAACNDYRATPPDRWGIPHFRSFVDRLIAKRTRASSQPTRRGVTREEREIEAVKSFARKGS